MIDRVLAGVLAGVFAALVASLGAVAVWGLNEWTVIPLLALASFVSCWLGSWLILR